MHYIAWHRHTDCCFQFQANSFNYAFLYQTVQLNVSYGWLPFTFVTLKCMQLQHLFLLLTHAVTCRCYLTVRLLYTAIVLSLLVYPLEVSTLKYEY